MCCPNGPSVDKKGHQLFGLSFYFGSFRCRSSRSNAEEIVKPVLLTPEPKAEADTNETKPVIQPEIFEYQGIYWAR